MMKRILFALLASARIAFGQEAYPGGEPVQLRAPEFARWVITTNPQKGGEGSKESYDRKTVITKSKSIMHESSVSRSGKRRERWVIGKYQYSQAGPKGEFLPYTRESFRHTVNPDRYIDYSVTDFPGFEWVKQENFTGIKKAMGRDCLVYSQDNMTAFVSADRRLPVGLVKDGKQFVYEFQPAPQVMLTPPPAVMEDYKKRTAQTAAR